MSAIVVRKIKKPTIAKKKPIIGDAKNIGNEVFREIVKMAYEMEKAEEQKKAKGAFRHLMTYLTDIQIESDYRIDPCRVADEIFFDGGYKGFELKNEETRSLFRYFVWKNGMKKVHRITGSYPRDDPTEHLLYKYNGQDWCMIEACASMVINYLMSHRC